MFLLTLATGSCGGRSKGTAPRHAPAPSPTRPTRSTNPTARPGQEFAYWANNDGTLSQYRVDAQGTLSPLAPTTISAGAAARYVVAAPRARVVYVVQDHSIEPCRINPDGTLRPSGAPVFDHFSDSPWVDVSPDGRFLYATGTDGVILSYRVRSDGTLVPLKRVTVPWGIDLLFVSVEPTGRFLYYGYNGALGQMRIAADGTPEALSPPVADQGTFYRVAFSRNGRFVYAPQYAGNTSTVRAYRTNADGTLRLLTHDHVLAGATSLFVHPSGRFLYLDGSPGGAAKEGVWTYDLLPNGRIRKFWPARVLASRWPCSVSIDPTGRFAYVARYNGNPATDTTVLQFRIRAEGTLTPLSPPSFSTGKVSGGPAFVRSEAVD